jgi:hypothetical protein
MLFSFCAEVPAANARSVNGAAFERQSASLDDERAELLDLALRSSSRSSAYTLWSLADADERNKPSKGSACCRDKQPRLKASQLCGDGWFRHYAQGRGRRDYRRNDGQPEACAGRPYRTLQTGCQALLCCCDPADTCDGERSVPNAHADLCEDDRRQDDRSVVAPVANPHKERDSTHQAQEA